MAWVRFTEDFDFRPTRSSLIAYRAGMQLSVRRACADQAIAAGKAVTVKAPARKKSDGEDPQSGEA
ncbi:hypothetical protein [Neorhizobium alkalisoli]|uniref:Uncharacterized protein n=1 Tax=Neorhizobium alkalisoli TaxID=528178 RepID=A0A561QSH8_9HYPH|nr:hypothetical protein [Neorhizobium alkalisoli]TWF53262.1 hypothetical protein FHW37_104539 [Neorhizobium alkalisoli]